MPIKSSSSVRVSYPKFDKESLVREIKKKLNVLANELPVSLVVLFGSYSRGNFTAASDIDVLIVYEGEKREAAFAIVKKKLDIPRLEPHIYTKTEYQKLKDKINKMTAGGTKLLP